MKKIFLLYLLFFSELSFSKPTILIIGDSHLAGYFGQKLDELFKTNTEYQVATYGVGGAVAEYFYRGTHSRWGYYFSDLNGNKQSGNETDSPLIENLISTIKPDVIMIELGGNYLNYDQAWAKKNIQKLETLCRAHAKLIWIGPPSSSKSHTKNLEKTYNLLNSSLDNTTTFIDSRNYSQYPVPGAKDGIHYWGVEGKKAAHAWAQKIYELTSVLIGADFSYGESIK